MMSRIIFLTLSILMGGLNLQANILSVSDFSSGLDGWEPNNPWTTNTAGGITPSNPYLQMVVGDFGTRGSKLITFNSTSNWVGNFLSQGVNGVSFDIRNWSDSDTVYARVVIGNRANPQQTGGSWWISKTAVVIDPLSSWKSVFLSISEEDMQRVGNLMGELGTDSWESTLSNIQGFRILSSIIGSAPNGDEFFGTVGIDNITLYAIPEPALTAVAMALISLLLFTRRLKSKS